MTSLALGPFIPGKELHRAVLLKIGPEGSDLAWFGSTHSVNNNERPIPVLLMNFVSEKPIWGTYFMKSQVQCSLASSQLNYTVNSFTSKEKHTLGCLNPVAGLGPRREQRGNFEKSSKNAPGMCRQACQVVLHTFHVQYFMVQSVRERYLAAGPWKATQTSPQVCFIIGALGTKNVTL